MARGLARLKVCLNGGRGRQEHPGVPVSPDELAASAALATWQLGARRSGR